MVGPNSVDPHLQDMETYHPATLLGEWMNVCVNCQRYDDSKYECVMPTGDFNFVTGVRVYSRVSCVTKNTDGKRKDYKDTPLYVKLVEALR